MNGAGANTLNSMIEGARSALADIGRAGLHALGPDNFEYYMASLTLIDSSGTTKAFMTFPVMPNSMMENQTAIATVTKTARGVVSQFNSSFNPIDISIQGTFGRKIRLILGNKEYMTYKNWFYGIMNGNTGIKIPSLKKEGGLDTDILIKTGYGLTQMMRHILDAAYELDENGGPHLVVFTNYSLNTSYVVEPLQRSWSQSTENNMLWYYNVEMKAIADAEGILSAKNSMGDFVGQVATGAISKFLDNLVNDCMRMIPL